MLGKLLNWQGRNTLKTHYEQSWDEREHKLWKSRRRRAQYSEVELDELEV